MDPVQSGGPWIPGPCFALTPFRRGVNYIADLVSLNLEFLVGKVGKPMKIIPMNARSSYNGSPFLFPKGVCLSVFTSIGPWSLLQNFVI